MTSFVKKSELKNDWYLIDGNNAAFGYVIEGVEVLNKLEVDDEIISIKIDNGADLLKLHSWGINIDWKS